MSARATTPVSAGARPHRAIRGRLVIATHNPGKLAEMRELLARYGVDAVSAGELGLAEPEETGTSFRANARIKAEAAALQGRLAHIMGAGQHAAARQGRGDAGTHGAKADEGCDRHIFAPATRT